MTEDIEALTAKLDALWLEYLAAADQAEAWYTKHHGQFTTARLYVMNTLESKASRLLQKHNDLGNMLWDKRKSEG